MGKSFGPQADRLSRRRDRYRTPERNATRQGLAEPGSHRGFCARLSDCAG